PYNLNKAFGTTQFKRTTFEKYTEWLEQWIPELARVLKPNGSVYICSDWQSSGPVERVLSEYLIIRNRITWEREKGRGAKANWKNSSEDIWFATKGSDYYFDVDSLKLLKRVIAPYRDGSGARKDWIAARTGNFRLTHPSNLWTDLTVPFWSMPENTDHP
ncbi:DNA methylase N-4/N-6 domain protein, partial [mine drainage metagenome]